MKKCGIYKITSPVGKIYIGQSVNISSRIRVYKGLHCKSQTKLFNSLKKYGYDLHKFEVICYCEKEKLNELETHYITLFNSTGLNGLNLKDGGSKNTHSQETKIKISNSLKGNKSLFKGVKNRYNKDTLDKMKKVKIGKILSEETRKKISEKLKGRTSNRKGVVLSENSKTKMSLAKKGKLKTDEYKKKQSEIIKEWWAKRKSIKNN